MMITNTIKITHMKWNQIAHTGKQQGWKELLKVGLGKKKNLIDTKDYSGKAKTFSKGRW